MEEKKIFGEARAVKSAKGKLQLREMELNSLLEITQAINNNLPENSLYKIFEFTLRANLFIKALALYVLDEEWNCKANFGTSVDCFEANVPEEYLALESMKQIENGDPFYNEFEYVFPVLHKTRLLSLVFVKGIAEKQEKKSRSAGFLQALSNIIIVAIENKKMARRELKQEALRKELEIASDVQQYLFPDKLPNSRQLKIEASYLPHDKIGGDYYDYIPIDEDQFLVCVADVSGKGIPAAILMSNFQASLRTLVRQTDCLVEIVEELNYQVLENAKGEKFITVFLAIYNKKDKMLQYVNAGHNPPILKTPGSGISLLEEGATVLGAINPLPFINRGVIENIPEFLLFAYTDGVTETMNLQNEEYGTERLVKYFSETHKKDLHEIHQDIIVQLDDFKETRSFRDDITMLTCRVAP